MEMFNDWIHSAQETLQPPCRGLPRRSGTLTDADAASKRERHFKELTLNIHSLVLDALSFSSPHQNSLRLVIFIWFL